MLQEELERIKKILERAKAKAEGRLDLSGLLTEDNPDGCKSRLKELFRICIDRKTDPDPNQAVEGNTDPDPVTVLIVNTDLEPGFSISNMFCTFKFLKYVLITIFKRFLSTNGLSISNNDQCCGSASL